jgi:protein subunit release factor A
MDKAQEEQLESQIVTLYQEKDELEAELGTSDIDSIILEFESLSKELVYLYSFKENYRKVNTKLIQIENIESAYIPNHRFHNNLNQ